MNKINKLIFTALLLLIISIPVPSWAEELFTDNFLDKTKIDMTKTTAAVDTDAGCVRLPERSIVNAIDVQDIGLGYAVATNNGIIMYDYDDATGQVVENTAFSCPFATDATGVSIQENNLNVWGITEDSVAYYKFNGSSMTDDPALKVSGLNNVLSVAAYEDRDSALVLQNKGGKAKVTKYTDGGSALVESSTFQPDIEDPVSISMINDSPDFVLTTETEQYHFMYDDATGNYVEDPSVTLSLADVVSSSSDDTGSVIATENELDYYINDAAGGPAKQVNAFSVGSVNEPVAVSLKKGSYEYAYIDENGNVKYYIYDDATDSMVRDSTMESFNHVLNTGYAHPKEYYSKSFTSSKDYDVVMLTVSDYVPEDTSINYYVSSNGGGNWVECEPGDWTAVQVGDNFVIKAELDTNDTELTPKINQITLTVDDDFKIDADIEQMVERGRNCEITASVKKLSTDEIASVDSVEVVVPTENIAPTDSAISSNMSFDSAEDEWTYTFLVPELTQEGYWPDNGDYQAKVIAYKGDAEKEALVDFEVTGHIFRRVIINTYSW